MERLTKPRKSRPVPLSGTIFCPPPALDVIVRKFCLRPESVGAKVTLIVQLALTASVLPQVLVCEKFPPVATEEIVSVAKPVFVRVAVIGGLEAPTYWAGKARLKGASVTIGVGVLPVNETVCVAGWPFRE